MIRVRALRDFRWSTDGVTSRQAEQGDELELPDDLVAGLANEAYVIVEREAVEEQPPPAEEPPPLPPADEPRRRGRPPRAT